ncbi:MAG: hypothetical protein F4038_02060 [Chloroflexi bacterium]|nr:hypothetical protein [Chloroflexota bacterium]MYG90957.1 hypothetical protein [Chloroflexota bacterium]MYJ91824.1 hypothetical protein [Chloroflexota bacterium]
MADSALEALAAFAESLGASASDADLERALPIVTRTLRNALRTGPLPDLGETEPAIGLRFDVGDLRGGVED